MKAVQENIDRFEKAHPDIKVKVVGNINDDKLNQALRAGGSKGPDVVSSFTTSNIGKFCSSGAFLGLEPFIEKSKLDLDSVLRLTSRRRHWAPGVGAGRGWGALAPLKGCLPHSRLRSSGGTPIAHPPPLPTALERGTPIAPAARLPAATRARLPQRGGRGARSGCSRARRPAEAGRRRGALARGGEGPGWWCPPAAAGASAPVPR
ncbi:hypothetical protein GCM10009601_05330 [Streptomyces thermospinosisporus]|uniref:Extracellular solute-binding protein n=1 Tax=Streptomyces thermospinosisporus TaxID=161482 RepID=A0ABN1YKY6_9ACTN